MSRVLFASTVLAVASLGMPAVAFAQLFPGLFDSCCQTCSQQPADCHCAQTRPVVQTQYRAEQVTTYRDVPTTSYRQENYVEQVPVTTMKNVTVDEGGYQMVWVPKPVTKQVAQTTMIQQVKSRSVPVTVMTRVPQVSTRMVPFQTVQHVTEMIPAAPIRTGCSTCDTGFLNAPQAAWAPPMFSYATPQIDQQQVMVPHVHPAPAATAEDLRFVPTTRSAARDDWAPVKPRGQRTSYDDQSDDGQRSVPMPEAPSSQEGPVHTPRTSSLFRPAPSAAAVWTAKTTSFR